LSEAINAKPDEISFDQSVIRRTPSKVQELVKVAVNARPEYFSLVARLADKEVPNKTQEILNGIKAGLPQLNIYIDKATAAITPNTIPGVMEYVEKSAIAEAKSQIAENQRNQILIALENQNTPSTVAESSPIVKKATSDNETTKSTTVAESKKIANDGIKNTLSGPTIVPVILLLRLYII
jgi:Tfp pilus assembly major pilin PilA